MKEIKLSFDINLALKQFDVHWIEEQWPHLREKVFIDMLRKILTELVEKVLDIYRGRRTDKSLAGKEKGSRFW